MSPKNSNVRNRMGTPRLWKVNCMERRFPGMWHRWYRQQCVAVGWRSDRGFLLTGTTKNQGWARARRSLESMTVGDYVVVALQNNCVGRLGRITAKHVNDGDKWEPLVPPSKHFPDGEMGRRIEVRWELSTGPDDRDLIVLLPNGTRFNAGELMPTIAEIHSIRLDKLRCAMDDPANWVGLVSHFAYEKALSEYIAAYPHHLEDGLVPHPDKRVREHVFCDASRLDVLLLDRDDRPVVVECKQGQPTAEHIKQLKGYMTRLKRETNQKPRGILVHGGSRKLLPNVIKAASKRPAIEVVQYRLHVNFAGSDTG